MNATETISLLLLCGVVGYIAEPYCFPRKDDASASLAKSHHADEAAPSQIYRVDLEALAEAAALREREEKDRAEAAAAKSAEAALVLPGGKESSNGGPDADEPVVEKVAFPIASLMLDRYEKRSATGSPKLDEAVRFAIGNNQVEGLVPRKA